MKPVVFKEANTTWAKNQPEYRPLPAFTNEMETISCWKMTWRERLRLLFQGHIWLRQTNQGNPLQPQLLQLDYPFIIGPE